MVIQINREWAELNDPMDEDDFKAYIKEHIILDKRIWRSRMKQIRQFIFGKRLKMVKKVLSHKFPPDLHYSLHGQHTIRKLCQRMRDNLYKPN